MNKCPMHKVRPELPPLTERIALLPLDERGYPVPFFVAYVDGKPDFRMTDPVKLCDCVRFKFCWVCGQSLGANFAFVIGPMCSVTRTSAEPPSHLDCALWSVKGCPFLTRPHMVRREDELTRAHDGNTPGFMIKRNPGVIAVWNTRSYERFKDGRGGLLFEVGDPQDVTWWREGREATRSEVLESIESGLPLLREKCNGPDDFTALNEQTETAMKYLPK